MNRALYIIGIVFSLVFFIVAGYYAGEVRRDEHATRIRRAYD